MDKNNLTYNFNMPQASPGTVNVSISEPLKFVRLNYKDN